MSNTTVHNHINYIIQFSVSSWRPVCGLLQVAGNDEVFGIMEAIVSGVDIKQPPHREQLELQTKAVVLVSFILKHYHGHNTYQYSIAAVTISSGPYTKLFNFTTPPDSELCCVCKMKAVSGSL